MKKTIKKNNEIFQSLMRKGYDPTFGNYSEEFWKMLYNRLCLRDFILSNRSLDIVKTTIEELKTGKETSIKEIDSIYSKCNDDLKENERCIRDNILEYSAVVSGISLIVGTIAGGLGISLIWALSSLTKKLKK